MEMRATALDLVRRLGEPLDRAVQLLALQLQDPELLVLAEEHIGRERRLFGNGEMDEAIFCIQCG